MNWKREAENNLKCYEFRRSSISRTTAEIKRLGDEATRIRSAYKDGNPVSGGTSSREDALIHNIALREELTVARSIAYRWVKRIDDALSMLSSEERLILDRFFIHRETGYIDRLCEELNLERSRVYELKENAIRRFALALYGVTET